MIRKSLCPVSQLGTACRYEQVRQHYFAALGDQAKADECYRRSEFYWMRCQEES